MNAINRILKATGMNQQMLADWLGIRRQSLMDAATGRKTLSDNLASKLHRLDVCIVMAEADAAPDLKDYPAPQKPDAAKKTDGHDVERLHDCCCQAQFFQKKLDGLQNAKNQNILLLKTLERMEPADSMEEKWIAIRKTDAIINLDSWPEADCRLLQKRIHLLHAEAEYISRFLNEKDPLNENQQQIQ